MPTILDKISQHGFTENGVISNNYQIYVINQTGPTISPIQVDLDDLYEEDHMFYLTKDTLPTTINLSQLNCEMLYVFD